MPFWFQALSLDPPPIPREHGAWTMLYAPLLIALASTRPIPGPAALLVLAVTAAFLAQNAAGLWVRKRVGRGAAFWLGVYLAVFALAGLLLIRRYGLTHLFWIGLFAAGLFLRQVLVVWPSHRRVDHSLRGEVISVSGLVLTAPAGYVVGNGEMGGAGFGLWVACLLHFTSSIFYVKMRVSAVNVKDIGHLPVKWRLGRPLLLYHGILVLALGSLVVAIGGKTVVLVALSYIPVLTRACWGWAGLSGRPVSLKRIGIGEVCYTAWFAGFSTAALRTLS